MTVKLKLDFSFSNKRDKCCLYILVFTPSNTAQNCSFLCHLNKKHVDMCMHGKKICYWVYSHIYFARTAFRSLNVIYKVDVVHFSGS